jgi:xylulokinase
MLPKDYLVYKLTGVHATDVTDASGTLLLDVKRRSWSREMCELCGVKEEWLPRLYESYEAVGKLLPEYEENTGNEGCHSCCRGWG